MTRRELLDILRHAAQLVYPTEEARAVAQIVGGELFGVGLREIVDNPDAEVAVGGLDGVLADIRAARPVQYIVGAVEWDGVRLVVREGVLVPRPETEELVRWVATFYSSGNQSDMLDVGTGSGAIAVALARRFPGARVCAVDVSAEALAVARENGVGLGIEFEQADILAYGSAREWDVVVSNPPYIPRGEAALMRENVLKFEPDIALFVDEPLVFYRAIVQNVRLRAGGRIFFECHESYAEQVAQLLEAEGFTGVELRRDINQKPRMVCGRWA